MINVFIVDDDNVAMHGIKNLLQGKGISVIGVASSGLEAITKIGAKEPDIVILDLYLLDVTGFYVCSEIYRRFKKTQVIFLTACSNIQILRRLVNTPAAGVLTKAFPECIVDAVKTVYSGKTYLQPDIAHSLLRYEKSNSINKLEELSNKDYELLVMFAKGKTCEDIGQSLSISPKTVSNRKFNLMKQIGIHSSKNIKELFL